MVQRLLLSVLIPLFTLSSIYSANASGAEQMPEKQLAGGKPTGYLQAWPMIWTCHYHEQIQLVVSAGLELGASEWQL